MDLESVKQNATDFLSDFFEDEIDAFKGTADDVYAYATGKPVHTSGQKWAKRAVTIATTVIPAGLAAKSGVKAVKIGGKTAKRVFQKADSKAKTTKEIQQLRDEKEKLDRVRAVVKPVSKKSRQFTRALYHATGDNDARMARNQALYGIAVDGKRLADTAQTAYSNPAVYGERAAAYAGSRVATKGRKKMKQVSALTAYRLKSMGEGSRKEVVKTLKKNKNKPMSKDDAKVLVQRAALGALTSKGAKSFLRNHPAWYLNCGADLVNLNYGAIDSVQPRGDIFNSFDGTEMYTRTQADAVIGLRLTIPIGNAGAFSNGIAKIGNELRLHSGANTIYTPFDLEEYLVNARTIMAAQLQWQRLLKTFNVVDPYDAESFYKYTVMALNIDSSRGMQYNAYKQQSANLISRLNALTKAVEAMIPLNVDLMRRTQWLFNGAFRDSPDAKYSAKMFTALNLPVATVHKDANGVKDGIDITEQFFFDPDPNVAMTKLESFVAAFATNQIHMAIAGDMMKVWGNGAFWAPALITGTETLDIVYDEEALCQIQNATVVNQGIKNVGVTVENTRNGVPTLTLAATTPIQVNDAYHVALAEHKIYATYQQKVVQTYKERVTPGDTLELTRFVYFGILSGAAVDSNNVMSFGMQTTACGSEIVSDFAYVRDLVNTASAVYGVYYSASDLTPDKVTTDSGTVVSLYEFASAWSTDDWAPCIILNYAPNGIPHLLPLFDFSNWARIRSEQAATFHYIANLSMLVPKSSALPGGTSKL